MNPLGFLTCDIWMRQVWCWLGPSKRSTIKNLAEVAENTAGKEKEQAYELCFVNMLAE